MKLSRSEMEFCGRLISFDVNGVNDQQLTDFFSKRNAKCFLCNRSRSMKRLPFIDNIIKPKPITPQLPAQ